MEATIHDAGGAVKCNIALPIAVLSLFKDLAALAGGAWRSPLRLCPFHVKSHTGAVSFKANFLLAQCRCRLARLPGAPSFSDQCEFLGRILISARDGAKNLAYNCAGLVFSGHSLYPRETRREGPERDAKSEVSACAARSGPVSRF